MITGSIPEKVFWAMALVGVLVFFVYNAKSLYLEFHSRRIVVHDEDVYENALQLPSITLCDYKIFQCTAKSYKGTNKNCKNISQLANKFEDHALCWNHRMKEYTKSNCSFRGTTNHPGCVTFNPDQTIEQQGDGKHYNARFQVVSSLFTGVFLFLHKKHELPINFINRHEYVVTKGQTDVELYREDIKRLPVPYSSNCTNHKGPCKSLCMQSCYARHILNECGAVGNFWKNYIPPEMVHAHHNSNKTDQEIRNCLQDFIHGFLPDCKCNTPCEETVFKATVKKVMAVPFNVPKKYRKASQITVFFKELKVKKITQLPAYDATHFMADVGGLLGLLAGMSALSVFEVLACLVLYATDFALMLAQKCF